MPQTIAAPSSRLAGNLAALGPRNADLARCLEGTRPHPHARLLNTPEGVPAVLLEGRPLCSRHRPLEEARRLAGGCDPVEHAVFVVLGFGAGHHVRALAERLGRGGLIVVFEPDVALLRFVMERIDHTTWMRRSAVVWVTDPEDRGALAEKLDGAESIIAQGVEYLAHPPSRARLAAAASRFTANLAEHVDAAKVVFLTTLMRSVDTVRNLLLNLDHYAAGPGIAELRGAARGHPAVVVSAGPSLARNVDLLAGPGVRDRCVIIAAQTALRPLLEAGVRPHFVTALDYHEISRRFYAGLREEDVSGATLVADPKANPVILDSFPGPVRCCASPFLDAVLGDARREMGAIPAGATVAHLALYLARHLGCDPVALIGQDLAFSDGLYYAPGTAVAEVWAPELNPFNTIEMMEWQRIVRHRHHLKRMEDVRGRPVFTDRQMLAYLRQFERDFARAAAEGATIIDATEGGIPKQHTVRLELREVLARHATRTLPPLPHPRERLDGSLLAGARRRVEEVARDVARLRDVSRRTAELLRRLMEDRQDARGRDRILGRIECCRGEVQKRLDAFAILSHLNQLGVFKRFRADRRLHLRRELDAAAAQRARLERDLTNVTWTADAAGEMLALLGAARELLEGRSRTVRRMPAPPRRLVAATSGAAGAAARVAALVPVDPCRNGLGVERSLATPFEGRPVIQATLERLGRCGRIESIILLVPQGFDVEPLIDRGRIGLRVEIESCAGSPFGPDHEAIAAARLWSPTCWRGGIGGMSVYDEVLCPALMSRAMERRGLTAALVVGPDWPVVDVSDSQGCGAIVRRHLELPEHHGLVFSQAPPGLCGCLVGAALMRDLARRSRLSTVGALLSYQPHLPQHDPIARSLNVQIDEQVSRSRVRATFDAPRDRRRLAGAAAAAGAAGPGPQDTAALVAGIERLERQQPDDLPRHLILELTTQRLSRGPFGASGGRIPDRGPLSPGVAARLFEALGAAGDAVVTLGGAGDPLLHPEFDRIVRLARGAGVRGVHVRTELPGEGELMRRLLECGPDVVSIDLNADNPQTYVRMMGIDRFDRVLENMRFLAAERPRLADQGDAALALPWIVPRIERRAQTLGDIDSFFDRWLKWLGSAVIEGVPPFDGPAGDPGLLRAVTPPRVMVDEGRRRMTVLSDGEVPLSELDLTGETSVGNASDLPLQESWRRVTEARGRLAATLGPGAEPLRTFRP